MIKDKKNAGEPAIQVLHNFNTAGVFGNAGDSMKDLGWVLNDVFNDVTVTRVGYCGMLVAKNPKDIT